MTEKQDKLINLSVHESSDPNVISSSHHEDISGDNKKSDNSLPDEKNRDISTSESVDNMGEPNIVNKQITIANLSAG